MEQIKILCLLITCLMMGLLIGCGGETGYYKVNVIDEFDFLLSEPKAYYKPGTKIMIKTNTIDDEAYHIYVNGVELRSSGYDDKGKFTNLQCLKKV